MINKIGLYTLAIALAVAAGLLWFVTRPRRASESAPISADAKAYVHNLQLSDVTMKATQSYVGQTVTEIEGKVTNSGTRTVQRAEIICIFYNAYGEVILRERVPIVVAELKPGQSRPFRLPFDDIPGGWNNQMPQLVIARIEFA